MLFFFYFYHFFLVSLETDAKGLSWKWTSLKAGGMRPIPRSGVSFTMAPNGVGYIFGGVLDVDEDEERLEGKFANELHSLDLTAQKWRLVELKGKKEKKADASSGADAEMKEASATKPTTSSDGVFTMVVGGGGGGGIAEAFGNFRAAQQAKPTNHPNPSARMKAGLVVCKGHLYVYGGTKEDGDKQITMADFYSLGLSNIFNFVFMIFIWNFYI